MLLAAIINYAPTLLQRMSASLTGTQAQLFLAAIALTKVVGVGIGEYAFPFRCSFPPIDFPDICLTTRDARLASRLQRPSKENTGTRGWLRKEKDTKRQGCVQNSPRGREGPHSFDNGLTDLTEYIYLSVRTVDCWAMKACL